MGLGGDFVFLVSPVLRFSPMLGRELWAREGLGRVEWDNRKKNQFVLS